MSESHADARDDYVCTDPPIQSNEPLDSFSFTSNTPIRSAYILQKMNDQYESYKDGVKEDVENEDSDFAILHALDSSYSQISPVSSLPSDEFDNHSEINAFDGTRDRRSVSGSTFSENTLHEEDDVHSRDGYHVSNFEMDKIEFCITGASVVRATLIPICLFIGRVSWDRRTEWEVRFRQKQLVQLHIKLVCYLFWNKVLLKETNCGLKISDWIRFAQRLPWTLWREKIAKNRVEDAPLVQHYIRSLIREKHLEHSEVLLSFLEISPLRNRTRYGPSLKEGYAHLRINGAFQLPLYRCFNSTIETLYRHLYRTWMRIAFASTVVMFMLPVIFVVIANLPQFLGIKRLRDERIGDEILFNRKRFFVGLVTLSILAYLIAFVYMFFKHRLGVIRRWVVLKPSCIAAYRHRKDREPSEVFLFDQKFSATKGNYRQGVSWMPNGLLVGSDAGFLELDTGHYYGRITSFSALCLVSYLVILTMPWSFNYRVLPPVQDSFLRAQAVRPDRSVSQANYCGYYFMAPKDINVNVDDEHVTIIQLEKNSNTSKFYTVAQSFWLGTNNDFIKGTILAHMVTKHTIVGILKKNDPGSDQYYSSGESFPINGLGLVSLQGIHASSLSTIISSPQFCHIPVKIGVYTWTVFARFILILLFGGFMAAAFSLLLNYLLSFFGIWHAHIRRDHWFRCIQHLQSFRSNRTTHRYKSFAPERISSKVDSTSHFVQPNTSKQVSDLTESSMKSKKSHKRVPGLKQMNIHPRRLEPTGTKLPQIAFEPHERDNAACSVSWHVDGEDTFEAMYHAIRSAKHEILIAGWWLCPDLFLIRPGRKMEGVKEMPKEKRAESDTQLRKLLLQKAEEGIRIYILIYREVKLALTLNSQYTKRSLNVHPNIQVLRDPIFQIQSLGFWSHHEKIVCIDQSLAFVGGLDLCFGRYDHSGHPLSDGNPKNSDGHVWLGKDYSNPIIKDFVRVNKPFEDLVDRASVPRMPWHDVHCSIAGPAAQDVAYHFIQRWNFVCSKNDYQLRTGWCICLRSRRFKYLPKCILPMDFDGWKLCYTLNGAFPPLADGESIGCQHPVDVNSSHLITPTTTVFSSFQSRWDTNVNGDTIFTDNSSQLRPNSDHYNPGGLSLSQKFFPELAARERGKRPMPPQDVSFVGTKPHPHSQKVHVQVVRSASLWSAGVNTESSIHEAYLDIITRSKYYIYIENQFFISGMNSNNVVSNRILQALVDRIRRAVEEKEVFRVYVLMPLLPAFEGNIRSEELTNLHAVMHWQFATICRGRHSLFSELRQFTNEPEDYVAFFGLRNYGIMPNGCVSTEQIYIHSKLLIADDCYVIIGSANINDRSMLGYRDSEIAVVVEDMEFTEGLMNGKSCRRGIAASMLRMQLFREHLGLSNDDNTVEDLLAENTWQRIKNISSQNTETFERVFNCAPSNQMRAFASFQNIEITQIYENQRLNMIKGRGRQAWDLSHLKEGDYAPWTDVNGVPIPLDRFDLDDFEVDTRKDNGRKKLYSMDNDGWCYARNFEVFQQVRTGSDEITKREKLQHFMTDRLIAQVRRRRWVKKGTAATQALSMILLDGVDDEELHGFRAMLKRHHNSFLHRAHSFAGSLNLPIGSHGCPPQSEGTPKTPKGSITRSGDKTEFSSGRLGKALSERRSADMMFQSNERLSVPLPSRISRRAGTAVGTPEMRLGDEDRMARKFYNGSTNQKGRQSLDSLSRQLGASIKRFLDHPVDFGRHSRFAAEYFDQDEEAPGEDYLDDSERSSWMSLHTPGNCSGPKSSNAETAEGDCQIGHVQTAAVIPKGVEMRARGMLSDIQGHLVDFPLDFLVEEMLKPPIMPADIHI
uniref:phospholipase D n=1 Tax=Albugo laibachii Nc14 TaxID=890382 RepID=F0WHA3_9STRA|nr:Phospholipase D putative [Albugo laibachii Nc14]|eukprot:CCA20619.1 Phospholipase D putative [Albugo laibachii Nc14]